MSRLIGGQGLNRTHIETGLMRQSLVDSDVIAGTQAIKEFAMVPYANIISLGGRSIIDRGKSALFPLIETIAANKTRHKQIIGVGSGTRARHTWTIALDLGIPTGGLAALAGAVEEQNTKLVQALLAPHGGIHLIKDNLLSLPLYLQSGMIPVTVGIPPYRFWEPPVSRGKLPLHGPDVGLFLLAEVLGARSMIFVKDEDGLYTDDPKKNPSATLIPRIHLDELNQLDLPDLIVERTVLEVLANARNIREIRIINGLKPETLTQALDGDAVGTVIYK